VACYFLKDGLYERRGMEPSDSILRENEKWQRSKNKRPKSRARQARHGQAGQGRARQGAAGKLRLG